MNKLILATLVALGTGSVSAQVPEAIAAQTEVVHGQDQATNASSSDRSYAVYRRVVLGDTSISIPSAVIPVEPAGRWVSGPYATYLMHNGMPKADALAQASAIGERSVYVTHTSARDRLQLTSYELYQRSVLGRSESDIISSRRSPQRSDDKGAVAQAPR